MLCKTIRLLAVLWVVLLTACSSAPELKVMTFNMRYDNPADGDNNWKFRRERVAEVIRMHDIDVFGAQELLIHQFNEVKELLPAYSAVGVGREDGVEKGEFNPVFFRSDRFSLLDSGTFWLSETPEVPGSKGWDGACERLATWVVLRDRGGEEFLFINTHLDHMGEVARREGVSLLVKRIETLRQGRPVILTGDFNADPASDVIAHVSQSGMLHAVKDIATEQKGTSWSFHDFGRVPEAERPLIDYIFVSDGFSAPSYEVLPITLNGGYVSDHAQVMAVLNYHPNR